MDREGIETTMKARRIIITAIVTIMVALLAVNIATAAGGSSAVASRRPPERIQFAPGTVGTTISGRIGASRSVRYVFRARARQLVHVHGFKAPRAVNWTLVDPDGQPLKTTMGEGRNGYWKLSTTGDHKLTVTGPRGARYRFGIEILSPEPQKPRVQRIRFAPGGTSATVKGNTWGWDVQTRYVFGARAGQVAHIRVTSPNNAVNWALRGPDGKPLKRITNEARRAAVRLPASGDYRVALTSPWEGMAYRLTLTIPPG
jgi:hypothetical protein